MPSIELRFSLNGKNEISICVEYRYFQQKYKSLLTSTKNLCYIRQA